MSPTAVIVSIPVEEILQTPPNARSGWRMGPAIFGHHLGGCSSLCSTIHEQRQDILVGRMAFDRRMLCIGSRHLRHVGLQGQCHVQLR